MGLACVKCGNRVVHPERKWQLCLDCLIEMLIDEGSLNIGPRYTSKYQQKILEKKGKKTNE
jgi:hypothetical protein